VVTTPHECKILTSKIFATNFWHPMSANELNTPRMAQYCDKKRSRRLHSSSCRCSTQGLLPMCAHHCKRGDFTTLHRLLDTGSGHPHPSHASSLAKVALPPCDWAQPCKRGDDTTLQDSVDTWEVDVYTHTQRPYTPAGVVMTPGCISACMCETLQVEVTSRPAQVTHDT